MASNTFDSTVKQVISLLSPVVDDFFACLQEESKIIAKGTVQEIETISENKQKIAQKLEQASQKVAPALDKFDCDLQTLLSAQNDAIAKLDQTTLSALQNLSNKLTESFELNQANGISVQTLSKINRFTLDLITGKDQKVKLYGSKGTTESGKPSAGAKLGEA
ncbi:flagellar protein FlgN [Thiomicrorhabdus sp. 6S2-11]|uniref:Flagellar protein FlgN n=1 Tax=Thiomicrorhabdus marina TaxID=2818442 RepID=A0ABS3Q7W7_9GAMM|nr:flagellar protein FlgN [Thiomicrorhabdus marina]